MRILSFEELRSEKGIPYSKVHLWRLERGGKFPKRVALGASRHGWSDSEVDKWIAARMAERGNAEAASAPLHQKETARSSGPSSANRAHA